jgi:hypothetical protein
MKYREMMSSQHEVITKKLIDVMIAQENSLFETRNTTIQGEPKTPPTETKQSPGRALWKKNKLF